MPRGVPKTREAMALFLNLEIVPPEMRPKGRGAAGKAIKVTVLNETAKQVTLQHTFKTSPRAKTVTHCKATFPVEAVVLYEMEVVEMDVADAPAPKQRRTTTKKKATKKRAAKKKAAPKTDDAPAAPSAEGKVVLKALRSNKGQMKMAELVEATEMSAPQIRKVLGELVEAGRVEKEGAGRSMTYNLVRKKRKAKKATKKTTGKKAAKKATGKKGKKATKKKAPKKATKKRGKKGKRKGLDEVEEGAETKPAKKAKKGKRSKKAKKGKKKTRFGSSRRKSSFSLDSEDE